MPVVDMKPLYRRARRTILWDILYYSLSLFCIIYLKNKVTILNWDVALVFLPLLIIAFSSETILKKGGKDRNIFKPFCYIDLLFKAIAYISSQLIYRRIVTGGYFWVGISLFSICAVASVVCSILMIRRSR